MNIKMANIWDIPGDNPAKHTGTCKAQDSRKLTHMLCC